MLARIILTGAIIFAPVFFAYAQHSFVGVKTCGMCHKSDKDGQQLSIWENSQHKKS